jgi:excisionase family DNA binding protein
VKHPSKLKSFGERLSVGAKSPFRPSRKGVNARSAVTEAAYLTPPEVARRFGIKPDKVLTWIATGGLVAINAAERPGGRPRWRISQEALEAFERRRSSRANHQAVSPAKRSQLPKYV